MLSWQRQEDFTNLLARFCAEHQPATHYDALVERIAQHFFLIDLRRLTDQLRTSRKEKRKAEIGFESQELKKQEQQRKLAMENRKQELHKCAVWLAEAKAEHQELLNLRLETPETRDPNRMNRILSRSQAA